MPKATKRAPSILTDEQRATTANPGGVPDGLCPGSLEGKNLLAYSSRMSIVEIAERVGTQRNTAYKSIDKSLSIKCETDLPDLYHPPP